MNRATMMVLAALVAGTGALDVSEAVAQEQVDAAAWADFVESVKLEVVGYRAMVEAIQEAAAAGQLQPLSADGQRSYERAKALWMEGKGLSDAGKYYAAFQKLKESRHALRGAMGEVLEQDLPPQVVAAIAGEIGAIAKRVGAVARLADGELDAKTKALYLEAKALYEEGAQLHQQGKEKAALRKVHQALEKLEVVSQTVFGSHAE